MSKDIDLQFRPRTYFRPQALEKYLLSKSKGVVLRERLEALFAEGRFEAVRELAGELALPESERWMLESLHPAYMGGNYLPDTEDGEVEIAQIRLESTTRDVTSVYARFEDGVIHYRVVDEYGGSTLQGPSEAQTRQPMTLGEFADFFMRAWPLLELLEMNFEDDVDGALGFFWVSSDFYPDLDLLLGQRAREHLPAPKGGDRCPFCNHHNVPPTDDLCEHAAAWVWDGVTEPLPGGAAFARALEALGKLVLGDAPEKHRILHTLAEIDPVRERLIDATYDDLETALADLADAQVGEGWLTEGAAGGSGYTVYAPNPEALERLADEARAIVQAFAMEIQTRDAPGATLPD